MAILGTFEGLDDVLNAKSATLMGIFFIAEILIWWPYASANLSMIREAVQHYINGLMLAGMLSVVWILLYRWVDLGIWNKNSWKIQYLVATGFIILAVILFVPISTFTLPMLGFQTVDTTTVRLLKGISGIIEGYIWFGIIAKGAQFLLMGIILFPFGMATVNAKEWFSNPRKYIKEFKENNRGWYWFMFIATAICISVPLGLYIIPVSHTVAYTQLCQNFNISPCVIPFQTAGVFGLIGSLVTIFSGSVIPMWIVQFFVDVLSRVS